MGLTSTVPAPPSGVENITPARRSRVPRSADRRQEARWGLLFVLPWVVGFLGLTLAPMLLSLYYSFTRYDIMSSPEWTGLQNFVYLFTKDRLFHHSLWISLLYALITLPTGLVLSLACAVLLNQRLRGLTVFRAIFFFPSLVPTVAAAFLFMWLFSPSYGLVNLWLERLRLPAPNWLGDPRTALVTLVLIGLWATIGGQIMITFLAALQSIPASLYEAADIDGVGAVKKFWNITVPLISPTIFFNVVIMVIGSFTTFSSAYITTGGGPAESTYFVLLHVYNTGFRDFDMGRASAMSWLLAVILFVLTAIQFRLQKRWVFYESEV